ncbi:hypothetical protein LOZ36_002133 [Ophidiomyces ophidiicola]|nr:hypothetical protein LOZ36_002133 [Ophidiomyces ophidiicola]
MTFRGVTRRRHYDEASGQMFTETTVPVRSLLPGSGALGPAWTHESPFLIWPQAAFPSQGVNSLKTIAAKQVLADQRQLTIEHFAQVPWSFAKYLVKCLDDSESMTLHMWKIFATVYPQEWKQERRVYRFWPRSKKMSMHEYFRLITSESLAWQTSVSVSTEFTSLGDLVDIATVSNLVFLEVAFPRPKRHRTYDDGPFVTVTDRLIRRWSEAAHAGKAFKHLHSLILDSQSELTTNIFPYLDSFPSLSTLTLKGCPNFDGQTSLKIGTQHGWCSTIIQPYRLSLDKNIGNLLQDPQPRPAQDLVPTLYFRLAREGTFDPTYTEIYHFRRDRTIPNDNASASIETASSEEKKPIRSLNTKRSRKKDISGLLTEFMEPGYS